MPSLQFRCCLFVSPSFLSDAIFLFLKGCLLVLSKHTLFILFQFLFVFCFTHLCFYFLSCYFLWMYFVVLFLVSKVDCAVHLFLNLSCFSVNAVEGIHFPLRMTLTVSQFSIAATFTASPEGTFAGHLTSALVSSAILQRSAKQNSDGCLM